MAIRTLPLIKVHGSPYQRGLQHGRQCGDLIRRYPDVLMQAIELEASWRALDATGKALDRETLLQRARAFLPQLEAFAPHLVEEVRGIADGAKLSFEEVLLANVRAEVTGVDGGEGGCTSFAVGRRATADGSIIAGQNNDQNPANQEMLIVLHVQPDRGPAMLMCTFAGLVGYPGINSAGVSTFQNALSTPVWRRSGMPHYFMKRVLLEQTCLGGCLDVLRQARVCSSGNYMLTDRRGIRDVELTPDGLAVLEPEDDVLVHANHFLDLKLMSQEALLPNLPDSASRLARLRTLISQAHGRLTVPLLQEMLSDHDGHPTSICRHQEGMATIASMVAEPDHGRLHVALGNPCESAFVTYSL